MEVKEPAAHYLSPKQQTELGELPRDWACCNLGDATDILTGHPFPSSGYSDSGTRLLRGSNVKRGRIEWQEELTEYWPTVTPDIKKYLLKAGDVVVAMDGSLVGRSFGSLKNADLPALLLQRVARVRSNKVNIGYLTHWICSERFTAHCDAVKTTTAIPHISPGDIRSFKVALPPTQEEQRAIADALTDADALINSLEQLLNKKRQIKQGAMQELLTGKRRLPGFVQPWNDSKMGQLGTFLKGSGIKRDEALSGDLPCVRYGEIYTTHSDIIRQCSSWISPTVASSATLLRQGDLLFAGSGETKEEIGKCVAFLDDKPAYAGGDIVILRPTVEADSAFLGYLLNMPSVVRQKASRGQGDAVVHISAKALGEIDLKLPEALEQAAVSKVLLDMDSELATLEVRLTKVRALKQSMAQALLTGSIRLVERTK